ncbi:MAG: type I DNA topoisomerase, partial [Candidatus Lambdaproteobacteria bacterium]|nr:type I DNA topoisomerase [Candidatus Lambdaproteobacteria bacterium]
MAKSLVIVESPTKARTIARFLDDSYVVESSVGHIRDLPNSADEIPPEVKKEPWARLGIDIEHDFRPLYIIPRGKQKVVAQLRAALKDAGELYLATDEDREGESISWHLMEVLKPKVPVRRLVFHEITKDAIQDALRAPRQIDQRLVNAQETRRVLDRLYGYEVSPVLWKRIMPQLSAGRVQSVAVRIIVQRERERMAFRPAEYWDLEGTFEGTPPGAFAATLIALGGKRLAAGKDFDPATGRLRESREPPVLLDGDGARELAGRLAAASWRVAKVERKPYLAQPPAPFTTSTLQQEANRKLRLTPRVAMRSAQALYERGYITYMRTDSTVLSEQALSAARAQIGTLYGREYLPPEPRIHRTKVKNAQEAHEAIRPAGESFRLPDAVRAELRGSDLQSEEQERAARLYEMIWKRTVASQMVPARGQRLLIQVEGGAGADQALCQATGKSIDFPGFLRAYVEGSDDPEAELGDQEKLLPALREGDAVGCRGLGPQQHVTQPPPRYSEAALIKALEQEGIGRPSTYASIIDTIVQRGYTLRQRNMLVPTFTAFAVVKLLEGYFAKLVDVQFTARMEDALDAISRGEGESLPYLQAFYFGAGELKGLKDLIQAQIDPREVSTIPLYKDAKGRAVVVRVGKFGTFLERDGERASIPEELEPDQLTVARVERLLEQGSSPRPLGTEPAGGKAVYLKAGRYGPYVQLGEQGEAPRMKSLLPGQSPATLTLAEALQLLSLPRTVGSDPETGEPLLVDYGRYGAYARRGKEYRNLTGPEQLFTIGADEVVALFRQEKPKGRWQAQVLLDLGAHPDSGAPLSVRSGKFGAYVTDGTTNASLP